MYNIEEIKNTIICGDCLEEMKKIPDESIDMVITSPPYYALRNYHVEGQIGLEETFEEYFEKILEITAEIKRVLKKTGQFWFNLGDCYASHTIGQLGEPGGFQGKAMKKNSNYGKCIPRSKKNLGIQDKCLLMMPERIALKMIDEQNWILRNKIKWAKQILNYKEKRTQGSVMPTSVKDRFNESGEELYFFVKNKKYYSNLDAVRLPNQVLGVTEMRDAGVLRQKMYKESKYNKFNYRVRDAKRKQGQPQFKASKQEIEEYKQKTGKIKGGGANTNLPWNPITGGKKYQGKFAGNPDAEKFNSPRARTQRKSLEERLEDTKNKDQKSSRTYNIKKLLSEVRLGIKPNTGIMPNKVGDPRGNHEGGPGSWRDFKDSDRGKFDAFQNPLGKNLPTIWLIQSEPHNFQKELNVNVEHFAIFPEKLCEIPIKFGCPKNGIVLDPFIGSGTTAVVAKKLGRNYIGIELNPDYIKIANARLKTVDNSLNI